MNDRHYPKGSSKGGQFAPKYGSFGDFFRDAEKPKLPSFDSYTPRIQHLTNGMLENALREELDIRKDIETINKILGGQMVGLEHALKSKESLAYKLNDNIHRWNNSEQEALDLCDDVVRYTVIFDGEDIAEKSNDLYEYLFDKGYKYKYLQNRYLKGKDGKEQVGYKDLNMKMFSPTGQAFEIQIMTPEMYKAKNEPDEEYGFSGHDIYDFSKIAKTKFKGKRLQEANDYLGNLMNKIYGKIREPNGIKKLDRRLYEKYGRK